MFTNGRSTYYIRTEDEKRQTTWLHVFGIDALPVLHDTPRAQAMQVAGRGSAELLAYDLALSELSAAQRARFAGYLSRKYGRNYAATRAELETAVSWPIPASSDICIVEPAEQGAYPAPLAPSFIDQLRLLWPRKQLFPRLGW